MAEEPISDRDLKTALGARLRSDLKESLREEEASMRRRSRRAWLWPAIAAGLLLAVSVVIWLADPGSGGGASSDASRLFTEFYSPYPNELYPLEMGESPSNPAAVAMQAYEQGDYASAVSQMRGLEPKALNADLRFYEGVALQALDRPEEAISALNAVVADPSARYQAAATWYLALGYLQAGDKGRCIDWLERITNQDTHPFREEALSLAEQLSGQN